MTQTINPVKNPSAELNATGYYTLPGTSGVAALTNPVNGGAPGAGTDYVRSTWSTASTAAGGGIAIGHATNTNVERIDIAVSTQYSAGVWVRASKAKTLQLQAVSYNAAGASAATANGAATAVLANTWTRITILGFTTPATGVRLQLRVVDADATLWSVGNTLDVDAVMVWPGNTLPTYSDPSTNEWMAWQASAHASVSVLYTPTITATPYPNATPSPQAEVFVQDPPPGGTVTITRTADNRTMQVRGAVNVTAGAGVSRIDSEIPFGVQSTYQAEIHGASGATLGYITAASVTIASNVAWISQPLDPRKALAVALTDESAQEISRAFDGDTVYPDGASVGRWVGGRRRGVGGLKLVAETVTTADADMLQAIFGTYDTDQVPVICVRTPPSFARLPRVLFLAVPTPKEIDVNRRYGGNLGVVELVGDEVLPPAPGLATPLLRYGDTDAFFGSYAAIDAAYGSYLARDRDYSKAGYSG